jgi:hypothetical protein
MDEMKETGGWGNLDSGQGSGNGNGVGGAPESDSDCKSDDSFYELKQHQHNNSRLHQSQDASGLPMFGQQSSLQEVGSKS